MCSIPASAEPETYCYVVIHYADKYELERSDILTKNTLTVKKVVARN